MKNNTAMSRSLFCLKIPCWAEPKAHAAIILEKAFQVLLVFLKLIFCIVKNFISEFDKITQAPVNYIDDNLNQDL